MRATGAVTAPLAALLACLLLAACGGDEDPPGSGAAATPTATATTAAPGTRSGLGPARFEALEETYLAQAALDRVGNDDPEAYARAAEPFIDACEELDAGDALLGPLREVCPAVTQILQQMVGLGTCAEEPGGCERYIAGLRATLRDFTRLGRRADRAIAAAGLTPACRRALGTPQLAYDVIDALGRGFALLVRGDVESGDRVIARASRDAGRLPSGTESLELFRRHCA